jgi:hypothetical protein
VHHAFVLAEDKVIDKLAASVERLCPDTSRRWDDVSRLNRRDQPLHGSDESRPAGGAIGFAQPRSPVAGRHAGNVSRQ